MLKKGLSLVLAFAFLFVSAFSGSQSANAQGVKGNENCPLCAIEEGSDEEAMLNEAIAELEQDGTVTNMEVPTEVKKDISKIVSNKDADFKNELKEIQNDGFVYQDQANTYITFENLVDQDEVYDNVGVSIQFFVKNGGKDVVQKQVWTDLNSESIIRYDIIKIENSDSENPEVTEVASYDINAKATDGGEFQTAAKKFKFSGVSFACSVAGVIACAAAFGGLTIYFPAAGAALSLGCVMAFNAGCAFS
ncbi:putative immunity/bacteriocin fusion bifunctional protein [Rossellomorea marisflavi]|uniref:putative immunity/bacteriocin fusion bifunctional protein n=1 Tax=Rossellomorea marisflavi TaxID=189381 RepID=UPI00345835A4